MSSPAGTAFVEMQPQLGAGFFAKVGGLVTGGTGAAGLNKAGLAAGTLVGGGIVAGIGAAVGLTNLGNTFDQAFDEIRIGTGATGATLDLLKEDFKAVFADIPQDTGVAAQAIADLNTRTGLVGGDLQDIAVASAEASRLLGEDLGGVIETGTRLWGDWGVNVQQNGVGTLDQLFRASQATGVPMTKLQDLLVRYGAPLRQFGFSLEEGTALLGAFEKEGVNTELVMGSLRQGLARFAKDGRDPVEALQETFDAIKNTGSAADANLLAIETFGARAGPDMAAAIREGRFEIGDLIDTISSGDETIATAGAATDSFGEKWTRLKNKVFVALEPLATGLVVALGKLFDAIGPPAVAAIDAITTAFSFVGELFSGAGDAAEGMQGRFSGVFESISTIFNQLQELAQVVFGALEAFWSTWGETITTLLSGVWENIITIIETAFGVIEGIWDVVLGILTGDWERVWEGIKGIVTSIWDGIVSVITTMTSTLLTVIGDFLGNVLGAIGGWAVDLLSAFVDAIAAIPGMFVQLGVDIVDGILSGLGGLFGKLKDKLVGSIGDALGAVGRFFGIGSPSKVFRDKLGVPLADGIGVGIELRTTNLANSLTGTIESAMHKAQRPSQRMLDGFVPKVAGVLDTTVTAGTGLGGPGGTYGSVQGGATFVFEDGAIQITNPEQEPVSVTLPREMRRLELQLGRG